MEFVLNDENYRALGYRFGVVVTARVKPKDIDVVRPGLSAMRVKFACRTTAEGVKFLTQKSNKPEEQQHDPIHHQGISHQLD